MDRHSKMQYLRSIHQRYQMADRGKKGGILDEFCKNCGYNRKYAIRVLNTPLAKMGVPGMRSREYIYDDTTVSILQSVWEAAGYPWSERLKAILPLWLPWARERFKITPEVEKQLLAMSAPTMDRRLKHIKDRTRRRIYGTTRPGSLLKHMIPIKTDSWNIRRPGFLEIDLVAHCGNSLSGEFINSLNGVDILTGWTETRAVLGRSQAVTFDALKEIREALPFHLLGIDPDNDGVFINHHLKGYCDKSKIQFTRSRPYKKDDNAHIEQKNWTHVRKVFGYARYDSAGAAAIMNDLYRNELRWYQNFFQPSVKLRRKVRIGSKLRRYYSPPKTPFQRFCEYHKADKNKIKELKIQFAGLNPFELRDSIDAKIRRLTQLIAKKKVARQGSHESRFYAEIKGDLARLRHEGLGLPF